MATEAERRAALNWYKRNRAQVSRTKSARYDFDELYRETSKSNNRKWKSTNPAKALMQRMRGSAKARGQECTIAIEEIETLLIPMECAVLHIPLVWDDKPHNPFRPSTDRLDTSRGYVSGNVRIVAWFVNRMRGTLTDSEFEKLLSVLAEALEKLGY